MWLARNFKSGLFGCPNIDVPEFQFDGFTGKPNQSLDIVLLWIRRILEDYDVPSFRIRDFISEFADNNSEEERSSKRREQFLSLVVSTLPCHFSLRLSFMPHS